MTTRSYYLNRWHSSFHMVDGCIMTTLLPSRVAFTLFISFLVVLQYLNLLQEKPSSNKIHRSLFSLTRQDHTEVSRLPVRYLSQFDTCLIQFQKSLLRSLDDYYKNVKTDPQAETLAPDLMANVSLFRPRNRELDRNVSTGAKAKNGLPLCPMIPRNLHGLVKVMLGDEVPETMEDIEAKFPHLLQGIVFNLVSKSTVHLCLLSGGRFFPPHCSSRHRVAIIVPYRDRLEHLRTFLVNIHAFLKNQVGGLGDIDASMQFNVLCSWSTILCLSWSNSDPSRSIEPCWWMSEPLKPWRIRTFNALSFMMSICCQRTTATFTPVPPNLATCLCPSTSFSIVFLTTTSLAVSPPCLSNILR